MPNEIHEVNMHAQDFQNPKPKTKKCQVKRIPNGEIITWKISLKIHQGMRYPLIHTKLKMSNSQREDGSKQTSSQESFMMAQATKKKTACLPPTHT